MPDPRPVGVDGVILVGPRLRIDVFVADVHTRVAPVDEHAGGGVFDDSGMAVADLLVAHVLRAAVRAAILRTLVGHPAVVVGHPVGCVVGAAPVNDAARVAVEFDHNLRAGEVAPEWVPHLAEWQGFVGGAKRLRRIQFTGQHAFCQIGLRICRAHGGEGAPHLVRRKGLAVEAHFVEQALDAGHKEQVALRVAHGIGVAFRLVVATEDNGRVRGRERSFELTRCHFSTIQIELDPAVSDGRAHLRPLIQRQHGFGGLHRLSGHGDQRMPVGIESEIPALRAESERLMDQRRVVVGIGVQRDPGGCGECLMGPGLGLSGHAGVIAIKGKGGAGNAFFELGHQAGDLARGTAHGLIDSVLMRFHPVVEVPTIKRRRDAEVRFDGISCDSGTGKKRRFLAGCHRSEFDPGVSQLEALFRGQSRVDPILIAGVGGVTDLSVNRAVWVDGEQLLNHSGDAVRIERIHRLVCLGHPFRILETPPLHDDPFRAVLQQPHMVEIAIRVLRRVGNQILDLMGFTRCPPLRLIAIGAGKLEPVGFSKRHDQILEFSDVADSLRVGAGVIGGEPGIGTCRMEKTGESRQQ